MNPIDGAALVISDLQVARGGRAVLHGVSIDIPAGEITTLLGPNGAGKSTLVLSVGGVLAPTGGSISICGDERTTELAGARPDKIRGAGVAVVPEGRRLLPSLTVKDNLRVATYSLPGAEAEAGLEYALELFPELVKRVDTRAQLLSGGEQQMLVLAQALAARPRVLLLDELSLGLAPVIVQRLMPVVERVAADGAAVLLIEQFAHVALSLAKTAYIMERGQIQYSGTAQALADDPSLLQKAYLVVE